MNEAPVVRGSELAGKIARLVEERGWNQEDFARATQLNRQTVREILSQNGERRLRNATVSACAKALGLTVSELRDRPLEQLLIRMNRQVGNDSLQPIASNGNQGRRVYEQAAQPELQAWIESHPDRARHFSAEEIDELSSLQGTGGPLTAAGVEHFAAVIERKRRLLQQVHAVAGTEYLELLEKFVEVLYEKVQPCGDRMQTIAERGALAP
jgi:transcriptional regulator with XRE-family HTH domain